MALNFIVIVLRDCPCDFRLIDISIGGVVWQVSRALTILFFVILVQTRDRLQHRIGLIDV